MKEDYELVPCFKFTEELCEDSRRHISIFVKKYSNPCGCQSDLVSVLSLFKNPI